MELLARALECVHVPNVLSIFDSRDRHGVWYTIEILIQNGVY